jgi:hypothetical protein
VPVDKAPADLWLQVASVKLFGFTSTALRLPEVTAAILVLGATAAAPALVRRRRGERLDRLQVAGAGFLGAWLVLGVGLAGLVAAAPRRLGAAALAAAAAVVTGAAVLAARRLPTATGVALAALSALVVLRAE